MRRIPQVMAAPGKKLVPFFTAIVLALLNGRPVRELAAEAGDHDDVVRLDEVSP